MLKREEVRTADTEPQTEPANKLEAVPQVRTTDTVSGARANEMHTVRRSYKDIVMCGGELTLFDLRKGWFNLLLRLFVRLVALLAPPLLSTSTT